MTSTSYSWQQMGQKLWREMLELTAVRNQLDLTDTFRIFHSSTKESTFFSAAHGHFSKTAHMLGYKASLKRHSKTEIALASSLNTMDHSCTVTTKEAAGSIQTHGNWTFITEWKLGKDRNQVGNWKHFITEWMLKHSTPKLMGATTLVLRKTFIKLRQC